MRVRHFLPLCLLPFILPACFEGGTTAGPAEPAEPVGSAKSALGGIEGSFEAALDAPWRIEPVMTKGAPTYGAIPIQVSIHDANQAGSDSGRWDFSTGQAVYVPTSPRLGNFCELTVEQNDEGTLIQDHKRFDDLIDVELTTDSWKPGSVTPAHAVCKPASGGACAALQNVGPTSEWHAGAWFFPRGKLTPGRDIPLVLTAKLTRDPAHACTGGTEKDFVTITNQVRVHLGEEPLPRFDNGWLYGDIHYHSQGTDNEGEAGYNYRGVMRAIGAMGVDFALASEHASNSEQIVDVDIDVYPFVVDVDSTGGVLRDMNDARFRALHSELWQAGGVNAEALVGPSNGPPQGYRSHGVVPRVFLGGEVDVIPEIGTGWDGKGFTFGNGLRWELDGLCAGWFHHWATFDGDCDTSTLRYNAGDAILFKDTQGLHDYGFARAHMVYLPRDSTSTSAFVGSFTGRYGGGGRRMTQTFDGRGGVLPEIARKGYAFLAHPVPVGSCPAKNHGGAQPNGASLMTSIEGGAGPDVVPYTDTMLAQAFQSPAVLGLEFWNEDTRLCTSLGSGDAKEYGFDAPGDFEFKKLERTGFQTGKFGLSPFFNEAEGAFESASTGVEWTLHHGARQWDDLLGQGIDPVITGALTWVPSGDPRKVFMGGGSDAHGDFNYRREGYMTGSTTITDTAIAKVRNLVFAGPPDGYKGEGPMPAHSQAEVVAAMRDGVFSVTDGPALRILVDRNRNGVIDAADVPMGGVVDLNGEATLPLLIEWKSTAEFGPLSDLQLYVGVQSGGGIDNRSGRTYAPQGHGPQSEGIASSDVISSYVSNGRTYAAMADRYWIDPTGLLKVPVAAPGMSGLAKVDLPIAAFEADKGKAPERLYVRAFAQTAQKSESACLNNPIEVRKGACIRRYAFTNPVWAVPSPKGTKGCVLTPRSFDRDGDGIPDGCDRCPSDAKNLCKVVVGAAPRSAVLAP